MNLPTDQQEAALLEMERQIKLHVVDNIENGFAVEQLMAIIDKTSKTTGMTEKEVGARAIKLLEEQNGFLKDAMKDLDAKRSDAHLKLSAVQPLLKVLNSFESLRDTSPSRCLDMIESRFPKLFNLSYPRRFQLPNDYRSPKILALAVFWNLVNHISGTPQWQKERTSETNVIADDSGAFKSCSLQVCVSLIEKGVPTYFVSQKILHSLLNTDLPKDFSLEDMPWPMDVMLFALPDGILSGPHGDIKLLAVCKIEAGKVSQFASDLWENDVLKSWYDFVPISNDDGDKVAIMGLSENGKMFSWQRKLDGKEIRFSVDSELEIVDMADTEARKKSCFIQNNGEEQFTSSNLPKTAFQIILAMLACPEMIEGGILERPEKTHKGKHQHALWRPNFFGKSYRHYEVVGPNDEPSRSHRAHWRRGHFRHQRFGAGRVGIKVIWIRPIFVNKDSLASA